MYSHTHGFVVMLKMAQESVKRNVVGLETEVVNCCIFRAVSGSEMCIAKVDLLQNVLKAYSFKVHKLL